MGPIPAVAAGIQVNVTCEGAFEAIDRAMHGAGCARLGDVEADIVMVAVAALQPPQIGSGLKARNRAIEVRPCPLCKMFACVLAKHTAPRTDLRTVPHEQLIALALVEGGKCEQAKRSGDGRHD